jgi:microcystin-dependent protein
MEGYMASIKMFAAPFAPKYWASCQGQLLSIAQNSALFSLLGTTYGGNGQQTFGLPDFRSRIPIGTGNGAGLHNYQLGELTGWETGTLLSSNLPPHSHLVTLNCSTEKATLTSPVGNYSAVTEENNKYSASSGATMGSSNTGVSGNNYPFSIMPPYIGMNFVICMYGIYPSRN